MTASVHREIGRKILLALVNIELKVRGFVWGGVGSVFLVEWCGSHIWKVC